MKNIYEYFKPSTLFWNDSSLLCKNTFMNNHFKNSLVNNLQCDYLNRASWSKVDQSKIYLRTKDSIFFSNKPIVLKNTNNRSKQNWKPNKVQGVASLSGNFAICWLVSLDPKFCWLFNGFGSVVSKWVFKLNFSSEIYNYDNLLSRNESLRVYITQRSWWY